MTEDSDPVIRDALRRAANYLGSIRWQHNRNQAQAAVIALLREMIAAARQTSDFRSLILAVRESADCPDWWPLGKTLDDGPPERIVLRDRPHA
jgi:hypothetical protein